MESRRALRRRRNFFFGKKWSLFIGLQNSNSHINESIMMWKLLEIIHVTKMQ